MCSPLLAIIRERTIFLNLQNQRGNDFQPTIWISSLLMKKIFPDMQVLQNWLPTSLLRNYLRMCSIKQGGKYRKKLWDPGSEIKKNMTEMHSRVHGEQRSWIITEHQHGQQSVMSPGNCKFPDKVDVKIFEWRLR